MLVNAATSAPSHVGEYIAVLLTISAAVGGWLFRRMLSSLDKLHSETSTNSAGLAVLVERVSPVTTELAVHDTRLRAVENGQARLEGALEAHRQWVQHAVSPVTSARP